MPTVYRKTWTHKNGWVYRLDIVPYDADYDDTVTHISAADANMIDVGEITESLDELPIGLMTPSSMTVTFVLNRLPADLQTYIRTKQSGSARNTFILSTDAGSPGGDEILFCGVQSKISSTTYNRENGEYFVEVELVDALQWVMSTSKPSDSTTWTEWTPSGSSYPFVIEYRGQDDDGYYDSLYDPSASGVGNLQHYFHSWNATMDKIGDVINTEATTRALRGTTLVNAFDRNSVWKGTQALSQTVFYDQNEVSDASPRVRGAALTNSTALLCTHIRGIFGEPTGTTPPIRFVEQTLGGLTASADKYGWTKYESWWDLFKDLCETLFLKATYTYTRTSGLSVAWTIAPVISTSQGSIAFDTSLDQPETTETENAIGKAEVRWESEYGDDDVLEYVVNADVSRADRSFNVQAMMHNNVIFKPIRDKKSGSFGDDMVAEAGLLHTNMIFFADGGSGQWRTKAHENVRIFWGSGASDYFDYNESTISGRPPKNRDEHPIWVVANQQVNGLPYALAQSYASLFGQDDIATCTLRFKITDGIRRVGRRYAITGGITTDIPHLAWGNAVATEVKTNVKDGSQTITFTLVPNP